jgi:hypothetical protein
VHIAAIGDRVLDEPDGFELAEMLLDGGAILFRPPREL